MGRLVLRTSGSSGGGGSTPADGDLYTFTSNVSSTELPDNEFLGGLTGAIESGTNNTAFSRSGWTKLSGSTVADWYYSNVRSLNRTKSLLYDGTARGESDINGGNARGTQQYDWGASGWQELYTSTYYYWDYPHMDALTLQWKVNRWLTNDDAGSGNPQIVDGNDPSAYMSHVTANDNVFLAGFVTGAADWAQYFSPPDDYSSGPVKMIRNAWFRIETFFKENSPAGTSNGTFRVKVTEVANPSNTWSRTYTNVLFRGSGDHSNPFRYFIYQNYLGNSAFVYGAWEQCKLYMDDHFMSRRTTTGAQRRVEMIDAATVGASTKVGVIQPLTQLSGTSRQVRINKGHWSSVAGKYLVEYDDTNTVVTTIGPL